MEDYHDKSCVSFVPFSNYLCQRSLVNIAVGNLYLSCKRSAIIFTVVDFSENFPRFLTASTLTHSRDSITRISKEMKNPRLIRGSSVRRRVNLFQVSRVEFTLFHNSIQRNSRGRLLKFISLVELRRAPFKNN